MRRKTTSIHDINADRKLNKFQKIFYRVLNWINNQFPYTNVDKRLVILNFTCENLEEYWARLDIKTSPSRRLSDLFWLKLPWDKIKNELGVINILDVGCGSGNYGKKLVDYSKNKIASYTGFDVYEHENWTKLEEEYSNFRFYKVKSNDISGYIPEGINFFLTQSDIEHFNEDLTFFRQVRDYIRSCQRSLSKFI